MKLEAPIPANCYEVRSRPDVVAIFSALVDSPIPITMRLSQTQQTLACFLVAVNPSFEELIFDASGFAEVVAPLNGSGTLEATVQINAVWFSFEALTAVAAPGYPHPAFRARMPSTISRMQRRNSIRYPVPAFNAPVCDVSTKEGTLRLRVVDISLSGIALVLEGAIADWPVGAVLENCVLHLPEIGAINSGLVVAYQHASAKASERRLGCRFSNMLASSLSHLQRYIQHLQRGQEDLRES